jgi:hypothetical protein
MASLHNGSSGTGDARAKDMYMRKWWPTVTANMPKFPPGGYRFPIHCQSLVALTALDPAVRATTECMGNLKPPGGNLGMSAVKLGTHCLGSSCVRTRPTS